MFDPVIISNSGWPICRRVSVCVSVHTRILGHWIRCLLHPPREARHTNFTPCPRHGQMLTFLTPPRHHYDCCHHHHHHHYHHRESLHHITSALNLPTDKQFRYKHLYDNILTGHSLWNLWYCIGFFLPARNSVMSVWGCAGNCHVTSCHVTWRIGTTFWRWHNNHLTSEKEGQK
jgi:hypothetical protein